LTDKKWTRYAAVVLGCLLLAAWASGTLHAADEQKVSHRVAVIPFQVVPPDEGTSTAFCPVCGNAVSAGEVAEGGQTALEEIFSDKLRELAGVDLLPSEKTAGAYQRISVDSLKQGYLQIIRKVGKELKADVVATGFVYRYRERVGYDYSAKRPASVAFEIHLISVSDGKTIWRGVYDRTQKSLMEDIFQASSFFKGGARWLTARQLAKLGVDETFQNFSGFEP